jgi:hypothetical protein
VTTTRARGPGAAPASAGSPARAGALAGLLALASLAACDRLVGNLSGGIGPESGILRGKMPSASSGARHVERLTDGIAAEPGDPWRTDLTTVFASSGAFVTWDLGAEGPVRCALVDADGDDRYSLSISSDGTTFAPLWTAPPDEDPGQQLRAGRDLRGAGRYLRLSAEGGDGHWAVSEVSAWSDCPKAWPPLAMQRGAPVDRAVTLKLWAFDVLSFLFVVLYRPRLPDWIKLLGVVPAGIGLSVALQLVELWPLPLKLALTTLSAIAWLGVAFAIRVGLAQRARARPRGGSGASG